MFRRVPWYSFCAPSARCRIVPDKASGMNAFAVRGFGSMCRRSRMVLRIRIFMCSTVNPKGADDLGLLPSSDAGLLLQGRALRDTSYDMQGFDHRSGVLQLCGLYPDQHLTQPKIPSQSWICRRPNRITEKLEAPNPEVGVPVLEPVCLNTMNSPALLMVSTLNLYSISGPCAPWLPSTSPLPPLAPL